MADPKASSTVNRDTDRDAVMMKRDLKNKTKALAKSQKALKGMKPEDEGYAAAKEEASLLEDAVKQLEDKIAECGGGAAGIKSAAPKAAVKDAASTTKKVEEPKKDPVAAVATEEDPKAVCEKLCAMLSSAVSKSIFSQPSSWPASANAYPVHPQVAEATILMEEMVIVGCNARTVAMISAFRKLLKTTSTFKRGGYLSDVEKVMERNYAFMCRRREATAGMRYVKETLLRRAVGAIDADHRARMSGQQSAEPVDWDDSSLKTRQIMLGILDNIEEELRMSLTSIVEERSTPYISSSDVILVFGRSSVVEHILLHASRGLQFNVIVIDSAPLFEGREMTRRLSAAGVSVTYGMLTACCTLLPKATRVFIGASSVLQNGDVFSRAGTAIIAACAKSFRRPVLCFSESYKFVAEVWLGNIGRNNTDASFSAPRSYFDSNGMRGMTRSSVQGRSVLSPSSVVQDGCTTTSRGYLYDLTPAAYVDMIICEMGCLHTSAIVAAIRDREMRDGFL